MKNKYHFQIRNLKVSFNDDVALHVPVLDIPRGKLIFVLGNSGCGKTTFIETLGLMSRFYNEDAVIAFYPDSGGNAVNYNALWKSEDMLSAIRGEYFSFMFQETKFLPQISVQDNIALSQVIKNYDIDDALKLILK